jgi:hypothetical protein
MFKYISEDILSRCRLIDGTCEYSSVVKNNTVLCYTDVFSAKYQRYGGNKSKQRINLFIGVILLHDIYV